MESQIEIVEDGLAERNVYGYFFLGRREL